MPPLRASFDAIVSRHRAVFLDAYGVLVDQRGAIAHAPEAFARLDRSGTPWFVLTNDSSRLPSTMSARFVSLGFAIPPERIVSSGDLLAGFFAAKGLAGARTVVLGPPDSHALARNAGADLVDLESDEPFDVVVIGDEHGYPMLESLDRVVTGLFRAIDRGREPTLVLPNPDFIYPKYGDAIGIGSGSVAALIEAALGARAKPGVKREFVRLGKPYSPIFEEACRRAGTRDAVLFGDQLPTDIRGANRFGIASALVATGVTRIEDIDEQTEQPTYVLEDLR